MFFLVLMFMLGSSKALGCVGARPMGMGGAFVGVADDVSAVYWNPAGLGQIAHNEVTYTRTMNNRDRINYDDFFAFAGRSQGLDLSYGLSYIGESYAPFPPYESMERSWMRGSVGKKVNGDVFLGGNLKYLSMDVGGQSDNAIGLDIGILYQATEEWTLGLLIQDINEPEVHNYYYIRNVRPAISYKPGENFIIAFDVYDFTDELERDFHLGAEYQWTDMFANTDNLDMVALRAGIYQENITLGAGVELLDSLRLDYAFLGDDLLDTHQIGMSYRF